MKPLILLTNDDGVDSPGLHAAIDALAPLGQLLIIAPTRQRSSMSRSLLSDFDGSIQSMQLHHNGRIYTAYHLDGSPAQTVLYGVLELAEIRPTLVVSGINYGENLGSNTMISGTVGAALQGADMGIRAIAISLETVRDYHYNPGRDVQWQASIHWLHYFAKATLEANFWPADVAALKIDIPDTATEATSWRITTQSAQSYYISVPTGRERLADRKPLDYEVYINYERLEPASDIYAFAVDRVISVTPLSIDLTARVSLADMAKTLSPS